MAFFTTPFAHQEHEFHNSKDRDTYALLWEQGTGKTKLDIDQTVYLYNENKIDGHLVVAPNGVHRNWAVDQYSVHCDPGLPFKCLVWDSGKAAGKAFQKELADLIAYPGLAVLCINYDAIITKNGFSACERFLKERVAKMTCDESHRIKTPSARRTKAAIKLGRAAKVRRILTGTAVGNSPFDLFSQFWFLTPDILGHKSYYTFCNRYGVFEQCFAGTHKYRKLLQYRNLEELNSLIAPYSSRVTKDEVLDLPDKLYVKRYYAMTPEQARMYQQLRDEYMVELKNTTITASLALVRLLRLQQIVCGYLPVDGQNILINPKKNSRLDCLLDILEDYPGKAIIYARFTNDIEQIKAALPEGSYVCYYGDVSPEDRDAARWSFQNCERAKYFIANPQAAGEGLTLTAASVVIYYSNTFKLVERLQSEDRAHRIGQGSNVTYIDILCPGTVDERIVTALREKQNIATMINGDKLKEWI